MPLFRKNIISSQVIKTKSDKLVKKALRDAKKKIKRGELTDSHDLALYLQTIDDKFTHLISDVTNSTQVVNYARVRADKVADTRQKLDFFSQDYDELDRLRQIVAKKAEEAGRQDDWKHEKSSSIDLSKLKASFDKLTREEN